MREVLSLRNGVKQGFPLALSAADLAALLNVSLRHIRRLESCQALPPSVKIGRCRRYAVESVKQWLADGCPPRQQRKAAKAGTLTR